MNTFDYIVTLVNNNNNKFYVLYLAIRISKNWKDYNLTQKNDPQLFAITSPHI